MEQDNNISYGVGSHLNNLTTTYTWSSNGQTTLTIPANSVGYPAGTIINVTYNPKPTEPEPTIEWGMLDFLNLIKD